MCPSLLTNTKTTRGWEFSVHHREYVTGVVAQPLVVLSVCLLVLNKNFLVGEKSQHSSAVSLQIVDQSLCFNLVPLHRDLDYSCRLLRTED